MSFLVEKRQERRFKRHHPQKSPARLLAITVLLCPCKLNLAVLDAEIQLWELARKNKKKTKENERGYKKN